MLPRLRRNCPRRRWIEKGVVLRTRDRSLLQHLCCSAITSPATGVTSTSDGRHLNEEALRGMDGSSFVYGIKGGATGSGRVEITMADHGATIILRPENY